MAWSCNLALLQSHSSSCCDKWHRRPWMPTPLQLRNARRHQAKQTTCWCVCPGTSDSEPPTLLDIALLSAFKLKRLQACPCATKRETQSQTTRRLSEHPSTSSQHVSPEKQDVQSASLQLLVTLKGLYWSPDAWSAYAYAKPPPCSCNRHTNFASPDPLGWIHVQKTSDRSRAIDPLRRGLLCQSTPVFVHHWWSALSAVDFRDVHERLL